MLGPSFRLRTVSETPIRIHWSFIIFVLWIPVTNIVHGGTWATAAGGFLFLTFMIGSFYLNAFGRQLMARRLGIETRSITLSPIGGVAVLEPAPRHWTKGLGIVLAGPAVNIAICILLVPFLLISPPSLADFTHPFATAGALSTKLFAANLLVTIYSLLPIFPMDAGRNLHTLLASGGNRRWATRVAARTGQVIAGGIALFGLFFSPFLMLIAILVLFAAEAELRTVEFEEDLSGWRVRDMMLRQPEIVTPEMTMAEIGRRSLESGQRSFCMMEGSELKGIIDPPVLARAKAEMGHLSPAADYAITDFAIADPYQSLVSAIELMSTTGQHALPVFDGVRLVGLLTLDAALAPGRVPAAIAERRPPAPAADPVAA